MDGRVQGDLVQSQCECEVRQCGQLDQAARVEDQVEVQAFQVVHGKCPLRYGQILSARATATVRVRRSMTRRFLRV